MTRDQQKLLNAACDCLSAQVRWHGFRLTRDDFRHLIAGTVLGWRTLPAWDNGDGRTGVIMLGGSSLNMSKQEATDAITMAFSLGDDPSSQGIACKPVEWSPLICAARGIGKNEN